MRVETELAKLVGPLRVYVSSTVRRKDEVAATGHVMDKPSLLHHFFEAGNLDFLDLLVRFLLGIYSVKVPVLGQDEEDGADSLKQDWLVTVEKLWKSPCLERVVAPDQKVGTLVDLYYGHCTATLDVQVVDVETKVVDHSVLHRRCVETWADPLGLE